MADGDICGQQLLLGEGGAGSSIKFIPLHMVLPRWFVAPTVTTNAFKVAYEVNVNVIFLDDNVITENIPLTVYR